MTTTTGARGHRWSRSGEAQLRRMVVREGLNTGRDPRTRTTSTREPASHEWPSIGLWPAGKDTRGRETELGIPCRPVLRTFEATGRSTQSPHPSGSVATSALAMSPFALGTRSAHRPWPVSRTTRPLDSKHNTVRPAPADAPARTTTTRYRRTTARKIERMGPEARGLPEYLSIKCVSHGYRQRTRSHSGDPACHAGADFPGLSSASCVRAKSRVARRVQLQPHGREAGFGEQRGLKFLPIQPCTNFRRGPSHCCAPPAAMAGAASHPAYP